MLTYICSVVFSSRVCNLTAEKHPLPSGRPQTSPWHCGKPLSHLTYPPCELKPGLMSCIKPLSAHVTWVLQSPFAHFTKGVWQFFPPERIHGCVFQREGGRCDFSNSETQFKEAEDPGENRTERKFSSLPIVNVVTWPTAGMHHPWPLMSSSSHPSAQIPKQPGKNSVPRPTHSSCPWHPVLSDFFSKNKMK
jgi:hypothetical protein